MGQSTSGYRKKSILAASRTDISRLMLYLVFVAQERNVLAGRREEVGAQHVAQRDVLETVVLSDAVVVGNVDAFWKIESKKRAGKRECECVREEESEENREKEREGVKKTEMPEVRRRREKAKEKEGHAEKTRTRRTEIRDESKEPFNGG